MVIFKHCGAIEKCGNFPFLRVCFFVELEISFIINKTLIFGLWREICEKYHGDLFGFKYFISRSHLYDSNGKCGFLGLFNF